MFSSSHTYSPTPQSDAPASSSENKPFGRDGLMVVAKDNAHLLAEVMSLLEKQGLLEDKKFCMQLVAEIAERVGYQCAGYTSTSTVTELIMMSAYASKLADRLGEFDDT